MPEVVIVAQAHFPNVKTLDATANELKRLGIKKVIIVGPVPQWKGDLPSIVVRNFFSKTPRRTYVGVNIDIIAYNQNLREHFKHNDLR
jgi:hypothetical protein